MTEPLLWNGHRLRRGVTLQAATGWRTCFCGATCPDDWDTVTLERYRTVRVCDCVLCTPCRLTNTQQTEAMMTEKAQETDETLAMSTTDRAAVGIIQGLEIVKTGLEQLRAGAPLNGWNARALSVALTELETAQLWVANARPD